MEESEDDNTSLYNEKSKESKNYKGNLWKREKDDYSEEDLSSEY